MSIFVADVQNSQESRITDVEVLTVSPQTSSVWLWIPQFASAASSDRMFVFNSARPRSAKRGAVRICPIDWTQVFRSLVLVRLELKAIDIHFPGQSEEPLSTLVDWPDEIHGAANLAEALAASIELGTIELLRPLVCHVTASDGFGDASDVATWMKQQPPPSLANECDAMPTGAPAMPDHAPSSAFSEAGGDKPTPGGDKPMPGEEGVGVGDEEPTADDKAPTAGDEEPTAGDKEPTAGDEEPTAGDEEPTAGDEEPTAGDEEPTAGDEEPTAGDEEPTAGDEEPTAGDEEPTAGDKEPTAGDEEPTADDGEAGAYPENVEAGEEGAKAEQNGDEAEIRGDMPQSDEVAGEDRVVVLPPPTVVATKNLLMPPLDLWTPGPSRDDIVAHYAPLVGDDTALKLVSLSEAAIAAVGGGDFAAQLAVGQQLLSLGTDNKYLQAEGAYLSAEGYRLLADVELDPSRAAELRQKALEQYRIASELLPTDPRPLRGLGRTLEVRGDYDEALRAFTDAKGLCLTHLARSGADQRPDVAHETLRTTRHLIHCLLDIRKTNPLSDWNRETNTRLLEGYLFESDKFHRELLPLFSHSKAWWLIEWFMGFVFLARAWGDVGNDQRMRYALNFALEARRRLMDPEAPLTRVERSNLRWWLAVAREQAAAFTPRRRQLHDRLGESLDRNDSRLVFRLIDDILLPAKAPW